MAYHIYTFQFEKNFDMPIFIEKLTTYIGCEVKIMLSYYNGNRDINLDRIETGKEETIIFEVRFSGIELPVFKLEFEYKSLFLDYGWINNINGYFIIQATRVISEMGFQSINAENLEIKFPKWIDKKWDELRWWHFVKRTATNSMKIKLKNTKKIKGKIAYLPLKFNKNFEIPLFVEIIKKNTGCEVKIFQKNRYREWENNIELIITNPEKEISFRLYFKEKESFWLIITFSRDILFIGFWDNDENEYFNTQTIKAIAEMGYLPKMK